MMTQTDTLAYAQSRVDHYRGRVASTQGAIVNLCDKPLHDESANVRLEGLCEYMVIYRQRLNYWMAQVEPPKPTVQDCADALRKHNVYFGDIYPVRHSKAIAQIEKYGNLAYTLRELNRLGFVATGEQDYMDDLPYCLIQITALPKAGV